MNESAKQLFTKKCSCLNHDTYTENGKLSFKFRDRSFFLSRRTFSELLRRGLVDRTATTLCTRCLDWAKKKIDERDNQKSGHSLTAISNSDSTFATDSSNFQAHDTKTSRETATNIPILAGNEQNGTDAVSVNPVGVLDVEMPPADNHEEKNNLLERIAELEGELLKLNWKELDAKSQRSLSSLACTLGKIIRKDLDSEKWTMAKECSNLENLISIDRRKWFTERNLLLRRFLEGCSGVDHNTAKDKKFNSAVHCVEQGEYISPKQQHGYAVCFPKKRYFVHDDKITNSLCDHGSVGKLWVIHKGH